METRHFFKVLVPGFTHRLFKIPETFSHGELREENGKTAILKSRKGITWRVRVSKSNEGIWSFKGESWYAFMKDHDLKVGDFLVFKHKGNLVFDVLVYDPSYCEKEFPPSSPPPPPPLPTPQSHHHHGDQETPNHHHHHHHAKKVELPSSSKLKASKIIGDEIGGRRAASLFTSEFCYFVARLKPSSIISVPWSLTIPIDFGRQHLPPTTSDLILRNKEGTEWKVNCYVRDQKQYSICRGWRAFARDNKLKEGDQMVFELVEDLVFHVQCLEHHDHQ